MTHTTHGQGPLDLDTRKDMPPMSLPATTEQALLVPPDYADWPWRTLLQPTMLFKTTAAFYSAALNATINHGPFVSESGQATGMLLSLIGYKGKTAEHRSRIAHLTALYDAGVLARTYNAKRTYRIELGPIGQVLLDDYLAAHPPAPVAPEPALRIVPTAPEPEPVADIIEPISEPVVNAPSAEEIAAFLLARVMERLNEPSDPERVAAMAEETRVARERTAELLDENQRLRTKVRNLEETIKGYADTAEGLRKRLSMAETNLESVLRSAKATGGTAIADGLRRELDRMMRQVPAPGHADKASDD